MIKSELVIKNRAGLHTRPAATLVKLTAQFNSEVFLVRDDGFVTNGKSIIGVMTLAAEQGSTLEVRIDGDDEQAALVAITELFNNGFGEL